jgi:cytochrome c oxidase subunit 4
MSKKTTNEVNEVETQEHNHPTASKYFIIALILSVITAIEVGIFYLEFLSYAIIPILSVLSIGKFTLVIMYYMHLKFDSKLFSGLFLTGLILASSVTITLMVLLNWFQSR